MRCLPRLLAAAFVLGAAGGCKTTDAPDKPRTPPVSTRGGGLAKGPAPAVISTNRSEGGPFVLPASGRIHNVVVGQRFVVIDYTLGGMPPLQSMLNVYRNNEKVGQIRLSGPERNGFVAADIVEGMLMVDDEVRLH